MNPKISSADRPSRAPGGQSFRERLSRKFSALSALTSRKVGEGKRAVRRAGSVRHPKNGTRQDSTKPASRKDRIIGAVKKAGSYVIVLACVYALIMPIAPQIGFWLKSMNEEGVYRQHGDAEMQISFADFDSETEDELRSQNTLIIPVIGLDVQIVEGADDEALERGAWRRPATSTPDKGGNTVITGHRFKYLPPSNLTFYHLDKVKEGDLIIVYWNGLRYDYSVVDIFVVEPTQIEVEAPTDEPRLTLYTCTPLWTASKRLVIVAEPFIQSEAEEGMEDSPEDGTSEEAEAGAETAD
ncbi:MAG: class E sortase [Candidatus Dojkabacteria bacterium]|nr:class E sortase [Candidatus Dojkabacteria bacterium]